LAGENFLDRSPSPCHSSHKKWKRNVSCGKELSFVWVVLVVRSPAVWGEPELEVKVGKNTEVLLHHHHHHPPPLHRHIGDEVGVVVFWVGVVVHKPLHIHHHHLVVVVVGLSTLETEVGEKELQI